MTQGIDLIPCPYCRSLAHRGEIPEGHYVECVSPTCKVKPETEVFECPEGAAKAWNAADPDGLRGEIDVLERRQEELESALAVAQGNLDAAREDLDGALRKLKEGLAYAQDLIYKLDIMETFDRQLKDLRDWCGLPDPED